jgi:ribose 5-phosphate isomerase B
MAAAIIRRSAPATQASIERPAPIRVIREGALMAGLRMRVGFAADHAGAALKAELLRRVAAARPDDQLVDLGGDGSDPNDDYPDFAERLGKAVRDGEVDRGILICGSGVGASVAANKLRGVRSAVCHDTYSAHQGVEHDDMNVLTLGARVIGPEPALECSLAFLAASFSGEPRHRRRLDKVLAIEAAETGGG